MTTVRSGVRRAVTSYGSPFGDGWLAWSGDRLDAIGLPGSPAPEEPSTVAPEWIAALADRIEAHWRRGEPVAATDELVQRAATTEFMRRVYQVVAAIPPGATMTYGAVAEAAGRPRAARAVGAAMARNPYPPLIPCHRVVGADGGLGGYAGGLDQKQHLLALERSRG